MSQNSVTSSCEHQGVSTVCTTVLLCYVTFTLLHHQTIAEDADKCAADCRCYNSAKCSHFCVGAVPHWDYLNISLIALDLSGNALDSIDKDALTRYIFLRNVNFRNNAIKSVRPRAFQGLSEGLMYLDLSDNMIQTVDSTTFTFIPKLEVLLLSTALRSLTARCSVIWNTSVISMSHLTTCQKFRMGRSIGTGNWSSCL
jgi:hypothetical protein